MPPRFLVLSLVAQPFLVVFFGLVAAPLPLFRANAMPNIARIAAPCALKHSSSN
jgi:hypothetical protein